MTAQSDRLPNRSGAGDPVRDDEEAGDGQGSTHSVRLPWTHADVPRTPAARRFSYAALLLLGVATTLLLLAGVDLPRDRSLLGLFILAALPLYALAKRTGRRRPPE